MISMIYYRIERLRSKGAREAGAELAMIYYRIER